MGGLSYTMVYTAYCWTNEINAKLSRRTELQDGFHTARLLDY